MTARVQRVEALLSAHPEIPGFTLVMTPPLPAFLQGGFGRVYRARNADGVLVAIKVPRPEMDSQQAAEFWTQECAMSRGFPSHENVVRFHQREIAHWPDGRKTDALVMEWLEGARGLIKYANDVGLDKVERVRLLLQAIEGVAWMHNHGTPHCDLKSDNMLVIERLGRPIVKVTDFGGTRVPQRLDPRASAYTQSRAAPEVVTGDPAAITPSADVYSLCKECAELLGSKDGSTSVDFLGLEDAALDEIVEHGTLPEPCDRFANADTLRGALSDYQPPRRERVTRAVEAWLWPMRTLPGARSARLRRGNRLPIAAAMLAVVGVVCSFLLATEIATSNVRPHPHMPATVPPDLSQVVIVRETSANGIALLAEQLGIEGVSADAGVTKRLVWAQIIRHLAGQSPSAIVLDIAFRHHPDASFNKVMVDAIAAARDSLPPVPVVLATEDFSPGSPELRGEAPLIRGLADAGAKWGCMNLTNFWGGTHAITIPARENSEPRLPLSVAAVLAARSAGPNGTPLSVQVDREQQRLRFVGSGEGFSVRLADVELASDLSKSHEIAGLQQNDVVGIYVAGVPADKMFAQCELDVLDLVTPDGQWAPIDVKGRVVLLAAYSPTDVIAVGGRSVPGVWFHAAAVQALLSGLDSASVSWWDVQPFGAAFLCGALLLAAASTWLFRWSGVPVARLNGQWRGTTLALRHAVVRWKRITLSIAAIAVAVPVLVLIIGRLDPSLSLPYVVALCLMGGFAGAVVGAAVVCFVAWMGCVRRAWCLDRTTSYTPLHARTPVPSSS